MKSSDEIFQLIKSMSGREKLFFRKKYLSLTGDADNNYLKLFDDIAKQTEGDSGYDESKIKSGKYTGKFIKNLSFNKNFLYNSILNSLAILNKDSKGIYSIRNLITQAEILADKMLYEQSLKVLQKAKKISHEKDLFNNHYDIINTERLIKKTTDSIEDYTAVVGELFDEQYKILELNRNLLDYYALNEKVGIFLRSEGSGRARDKDILHNFEKIFDNPLLKDIENAGSFLAQYIFYNLNLQYHLTKENYEEAYICAKAAVELCEKNLEKLVGKLDNYIFSLNNLINCESRSGREPESEITAFKMKNLPDEFPGMLSESNKVFIFYSFSVMMISNYITAADEEKMSAIENEIRKEIHLYEDKMMVYLRIILYYFMSISNFVRDEFDKCIYWNAKIFNLGKTDLSEDYQCYARIIQLISYYELGYIDSMEYALKSAYHFISKKKKAYKYESIIQKYLRRSFRIKTDKELTEMFREMTNELEVIFEDEYEKHAFDAFNILYWLESKLKKIPLIEILRQKNSVK
ncbi:MAG: hypothetical protein ABI528_02115 [bacterium]